MSIKYAKMPVHIPAKCPYRDALRSERTGHVAVCMCRHSETSTLFCNNDGAFPENCPLEDGE